MICTSLLATLLTVSNPTAQELAVEAYDNQLFSTANSKATIELEIMKRSKVVRKRKVRTQTKRQAGQTKSLVEFTHPQNVAGTRFLSLENDAGTEQFMYLPAFKKVKRIVGTQKKKSFMGTDFSFRDLEGRDVEDATWKRLKDEAVLGEPCYVLESTPKDPDEEPYGKTLIWLHQERRIPLRTDFYNSAKSEVMKRMTVQKVRKKDGRWIAVESLMETLAKNSATRLLVRQIDLTTPLQESLFTREALER